MNIIAFPKDSWLIFKKNTGCFLCEVGANVLPITETKDGFQNFTYVRVVTVNKTFALSFSEKKMSA
jgi:hypothetical protein